MPNVDRVEVLSSIQRRRRYSLDQNLQVRQADACLQKGQVFETPTVIVNGR